jgi:serine protease Do
VSDSRRLQLTVAETVPGTTVPVQILRDGEKKTLDVTVKQLPGNDKLADANSSQGEDTGTLNGVQVADLDQQAHDQFNVPKDVKGAVVTEVEPGSAAAEAGLKAGDVIQEINRKPVKNAEEAVKLTEKSTDDKRTLVRVWENGGSHYIVVDESNNAG